MTKNPRTIIRTTRGRLGIAAAGAVMLMTIFTPVASASVASADDTSGGSIPVTGTLPDGTQCTSYWTWAAAVNSLGGGATAVEWTANPCDFRIQERSWCRNADGSGSWSTSGIVAGVDVPDGSSCGDNTTITRGEKHFNFGSGWNTYTTFWTNPAA